MAEEGQAPATWVPLDDNGWAELRVNGKRITTLSSYAAASEAAERINAALKPVERTIANEALRRAAEACRRHGDDMDDGWLTREDKAYHEACHECADKIEALIKEPGHE